MPDNHLAQIQARTLSRWTAFLSVIALSACAGTMVSTPDASNSTSTPQVAPAPIAAIPPDAPKSANSSANPAEREVVDVAWMSGDFSHAITEAVTCQDIGVLVTTRGYAEGEDVNVSIGEKNGPKERDVTLYGKVDADGKVRIPWPAMGCVDDKPTPLLGGSAKRTPAVDAPRSSKNRPKHKAVSSKPSKSPNKEKSTPFDDPATMIDPPRSTLP